MVVALVTEIIAEIVMQTYFAAFKKTMVYGYRTLVEKQRIIQFWRVKEVFGIFFGLSMGCHILWKTNERKIPLFDTIILLILVFSVCRYYLDLFL